MVSSKLCRMMTAVRQRRPELPALLSRHVEFQEPLVAAVLGHDTQASAGVEADQAGGHGRVRPEPRVFTGPPYYVDPVAD